MAGVGHLSALYNCKCTVVCIRYARMLGTLAVDTKMLLYNNRHKSASVHIAKDVALQLFVV